MSEREKSPAELAMEALGAWNQALAELNRASDLARQVDGADVLAAEQAFEAATRHAESEILRYLELKRKWDESLLQ